MALTETQERFAMAIGKRLGGDATAWADFVDILRELVEADGRSWPEPAEDVDGLIALTAEAVFGGALVMQEASIRQMLADRAPSSEGF